MKRAFGASCLVACMSCDACSGEPAVPFKLDPTGTVSGQPSKAAAPLEPPFVLRPSRPLQRNLLGGARSSEAITMSNGEFVVATRGSATEVIFVGGGSEETLISHTPAEGCRTGVTLRAFGQTHAVAEMIDRCAAGTASFASALLATPRAQVFYAAETRAPTDPPILLSIELLDADDDGQADLSLSLRTGNEDPPTEIRVLWQQNGSGWAREATEPEATLRNLADAAESALETQATKAVAMASTVLALHRAGCTTDEPALVVFARQKGLGCSASAGAGHAAAVLVAANAKLNRPADAIDAYGALSRPWLALNAQHRALATRAIARLAASRRYTLALAPADETPAPPSLANADGTLAVRKIFRDCDGYHVEIIPGPATGADVWTAPVLSAPLVRDMAPPEHASCPLSGTLRDDTGNLAVLGWAPQGVIVAHGLSATVISVDDKGNAIGAYEPVSADAPLPAPITRGAATRDGRAYAFALDAGIVIRVAGGAEIVRVPEWRDDAGPITGLAISEDATSFTFMRGGSHWILRPGDPAVPAEPN